MDRIDKRIIENAAATIARDALAGGESVADRIAFLGSKQMEVCVALRPGEDGRYLIDAADPQVAARAEALYLEMRKV
jgi:hypothetical protein